ncbi:MAG TPA: hypothetical protein VG944_12285 [Fimbriimonas sp.]|nr:hypothetical protein [Fimbriimonas sp.]
MSDSDAETPSQKPEEEKDAGTPTGEQKASSVEDELASSAERIRVTAKWLVATFGAVAGALIAGLQLSDIGKLEGSDHTIAAIAVAVALGAVIAIVFLASLVLARGRVALSDLSKRAGKARKQALVDELERSPGLYSPYDTVGDFADAISDEWSKQSKSWMRVQTTDDAEEKYKALSEFEATKKVLPGLNRINKRLLAVARAEDVRLTFQWVSKSIAVLAVVAAAGAGTFAYVNSAPDEEVASAAVPEQPVVAIADLTTSGEEELESSFGEKCDLERVEVVALDSSEDGWEVVSLPVDGCESARVTIAENDGEVHSIDPVELDLPEQ